MIILRQNNFSQVDYQLIRKWGDKETENLLRENRRDLARNLIEDRKLARKLTGDARNKKYKELLGKVKEDAERARLEATKFMKDKKKGKNPNIKNLQNVFKREVTPPPPVEKVNVVAAGNGNNNLKNNPEVFNKESSLFKKILNKKVVKGAAIGSAVIGGAVIGNKLYRNYKKKKAEEKTYSEKKETKKKVRLRDVKSNTGLGRTILTAPLTGLGSIPGYITGKREANSADDEGLSDLKILQRAEKHGNKIGALTGLVAGATLPLGSGSSANRIRNAIIAGALGTIGGGKAAKVNTESRLRKRAILEEEKENDSTKN